MSDERVFDCAVCGKKKMYVNAVKGVWFCFVCNKGGYDEAMKTMAHPLWECEIPELQPESPPANWSLTHKSLVYLESRVSQKIMPFVRGNTRSTSKGLLFKFPYVEGYWQERRWSQFSPPRWKNPKNAKTTKDGVYYEAKPYFVPNPKPWDNPAVVVVEGIFDALAVAEFLPAVAALSKVVHPKQAEKLRSMYDKAILMVDADVDLDTISSNILTMGATGLEVTTVILPPGEDPSSVGSDFLKAVLLP